jgi:hypothetical protein
VAERKGRNKKSGREGRDEYREEWIKALHDIFIIKFRDVNEQDGAGLLLFY